MQLPVNQPLRLLITTDAVGGVWTYTLDLARSLRRAGVRVSIATLGPAPSQAQVDSAKATGATLHVLDAPLDWMAEDVAGVAHASHAIAALARQLRADLVQTHSPAFLAHASLPCPSISVVHSCVATWWDAVRGGDMPDSLRWRARLVAEGLARATVNVAPTSSFAYALTRAYGGAPPLVAHNAREPAAIAQAEGADFVVSAGRFWDESKDFDTLDRAAACSELPVVAAGPLASPFGGAIAPRFVDARGPLAPAALQALLATRPVFCSTAVYEPFGLAVLEAAQAGCALVLSAIPTFQELWGDAALFAPARDHKAFAAALNALAQDRDWRAALGEAAHRRAAHFSVERQASEMLQIYHRALHGDHAEAAA